MKVKLIDNLLIESRAIADEVYNTSRGLRDEILYNIAMQTEVRHKEYSYKTGEINYNIFGDNYIVSYELFIIYPHTDPRKFSHGAVVDNEQKTMHLKILNVFGKIDPLTLNDAIQHEVEHIYQQKKRNGNSIIGNSNRSKELYKLASQKLNSINSYEQLAARIIYVYYKCEEDAFVNGMYGYLMQCKEDGIDYRTAVQRSEIYRYYYYFKQILPQLEALHDGENKELSQAIGIFGITLKGLITRLKKNIKRLKNKMKMVIAKALNNDEEVHWERLIDECKKLSDYIPYK